MSIERKFMKNKYEYMNSPEYKKIRKEQLLKIKKMRSCKPIKSSREYLAIVNHVNNSKRIESRDKINKIIMSEVKIDE